MHAVSSLAAVLPKQFVDYTRTLLHMIVTLGSVVWIPPGFNELIVSSEESYTALAFPFYSSVMVRALGAGTSDIVQQECMAHAASLKTK